MHNGEIILFKGERRKRRMGEQNCTSRPKKEIIASCRKRGQNKEIGMVRDSRNTLKYESGRRWIARGDLCSKSKIEAWKRTTGRYVARSQSGIDRKYSKYGGSSK